MSFWVSHAKESVDNIVNIHLLGIEHLATFFFFIFQQHLAEKEFTVFSYP